MQMRRVITVVALLAGVSSDLASQQGAPDADARQIRTARASYNLAIAAHDTLAMSRHWVPEYVGVSSTNTVTVGRDAMRSRFADLIKARPGLVFVRTPDSVTVNGAWRQAAEYGTWTGQWTQPDGVTTVGGRYFAKWVKRDAQWMLLSEVFVQTTCSGSSYCLAP